MPSQRRLQSLHGVIGLSLLFSGCVARDAGFPEVKTVLRERTGHAVVYRDSEGAAAGEKEAAQLLTRPLDAEAAVALSLLQNPQLQAAFSQLGVARAQLVSASLPANPELSAEVTWHGEVDAPNLGFGVTQNLTQLITLPLLQSAASTELTRASAQAAGVALDIAYQVRLAFYDVVAAEQDLALLRSVVQTAALSRELTQRVHAAGNVNDLALALARAFEEEAHLRVENAQLAVTEKRAVLARLLALRSDPAALRLVSGLAEPAADESALAQLERVAIERSLDLLVLTRAAEALSARVTAAQVSGVLPELHAGVVVERDHGEWEMGPTAAVSLPIFDRGQGQVAGLRARQNALGYERTAKELEIRTAVLRLRERSATLAARVRRYQHALLPLRKQIVQESLLQYNAMQIGAAQLIAAKSEELEAGRAHVAALRSYWFARAALDQVLAGRLPPELAVELAAGAQSPMPSAAPGAGGH